MPVIPAWRVFDFNSRQATEGDIYNVAEIPVISKVKEVSHRRLRFWFTPPIKATSWKVIEKNTGKIMNQGSKPEVQFPDQAYDGTLCFIPEGVSLLKIGPILACFGKFKHQLAIWNICFVKLMLNQNALRYAYIE